MAANVSTLKTELLGDTKKDEDEIMDCSAEPLEDGEISDDENGEVAPLAETEDTFFDGATENSKSDAAKRFALIGDLSLALPKKELNSLYESLGIDADNERHYCFNTINLRNAFDMKTFHIMEYFSGLEPVRVDWLDDGVCNVQWDDEILPARALLYLSVEIKNIGKLLKKESGILVNSDSEDDVIVGDVVDARKLKFPLPPGHWRKGNPCDQSKDIIMRYANKDDKIVKEHRSRHSHRHKHGKRLRHEEISVDEPVKNPWGDLAQSWGHGEGMEKQIWSTAAPRNIPDLRSSLNDTLDARIADAYIRKAVASRRVMPPTFESSEESSGSDSERDFLRRHKLPKMHADREEQKKKLEIACKSGDLRARLAHKSKFAPPPPPPSHEIAHSDESGDELSTDWATEGYVDLRRTLVNKERSGDDLDTDSDLDLGEEDVGEMLQIEVDNEYYNGKKNRRRH